MKTRNYLLVAIPLLTLSMTGCSDLLNSAGLGSDEEKKINTVLLDLSVIVKATGQDEIIKQKLEKSKSDINLKIMEARKSMEEKLNEEREKLGKKPKDAEKANFQQMAMQADQQLRSMQTDAQNKLRQYEASLLEELRNLIQPVAEKIARERGAQSAQIINPSLLWHDASIEITDEVIAALNASSTTSESTQDITATETPVEPKEIPETMPATPDVITDDPAATPENPVTEAKQPDAEAGKIETMPESPEAAAKQTADDTKQTMETKK
jgi:Skp family chaperone for outer membrane proteins